MEARRPDARRPVGRLARASTAGVAFLALATGCIAPNDDDSTANTIDVERESRQQGDIETTVGETVEINGVRVTVVEVGRVDAYNDLDTSGYIWARLEVENVGNSSVEFHRRHFRLEKPDGMLSNTANISTESQIAGGTTARSDQLDPGETRSGQVIYTAGDLEGQFALLYLAPSRNDDPLDRQRGVWVFESSPDDAA